jgi:hypothetical protein
MITDPSPWRRWWRPRPPRMNVRLPLALSRAPSFSLLSNLSPKPTYPQTHKCERICCLSVRESRTKSIRLATSPSPNPDPLKPKTLTKP